MTSHADRASKLGILYPLILFTSIAIASHLGTLPWAWINDVFRVSSAIFALAMLTWELDVHSGRRLVAAPLARKAHLVVLAIFGAGTLAGVGTWAAALVHMVPAA